MADARCKEYRKTDIRHATHLVFILGLPKRPKTVQKAQFCIQLNPKKNLNFSFSRIRYTAQFQRI
jgi:hypothetical protein